ncbi:MAG: class I SAM-dependent methyltransferase [Bryobacteraceae bacterium]|jgi:precorrin-6B methylase 2
MTLKAKLSITVLTLAAVALAQGPPRPLDVPYVPTSQELVVAMLKLADVRPGDTVYDLGCGDGRIVVAAAKQFGARAVGVDINPQRISEANENARQAGVADKVKFIEGNLFDADIHEATVVTLYLLPNVNLRLRPKLLQELRPGTRVVSHSFDMDDWKPDQEIEVNNTRLLLWVIPPQK